MAELKTKTIIGLEIHVQLQTATKMFCGCKVEFDAPPNSRVCPVCLGHPGTLPVINRGAVELALTTGLALGCKIAEFTKWDRKSYYYPDLPKNYQISQYDLPICYDGLFAVESEDGVSKVRIRRAHLEEDAGKNMHDIPGCTLVDLNRAGTPLLEIVTEPDLESAEAAYAFCTELQRLVTYLGASEGVMQKGQMRFEPNVNVEIENGGDVYRTPISEVKNLNSFRAVRDAIDYESRRQVEAWKENHDYVFGKAQNENRGWNADRGITEFQRSKEAAHDYRYFPDPDLVPVTFTTAEIDARRETLPELPRVRQRRFENDFNLTSTDAETILSHKPTADHFEAVIESGGPAAVASKQFVNVWLKLANDRGERVTDLGVDAGRMAELASAVSDGAISATAANKIAEVMLERSERPAALAEELGLVQVTDTGATEAWIDEAIAANEQAVSDALENPKKAKAAAGFLRGQVMRISGGKADPKLVGELIEKKLTEMGGRG